MGICQYALLAQTDVGALLFPCELGDGHLEDGSQHQAHHPSRSDARFYDLDPDDEDPPASVELIVRWRRSYPDLERDLDGD